MEDEESPQLSASSVVLDVESDVESVSFRASAVETDEVRREEDASSSSSSSLSLAVVVDTDDAVVEEEESSPFMGFMGS